MSADARDRIGAELSGGKAAIGVLADASESAAISAKLAELGGAPEVHDLDQAAVTEVDAAVVAAPVEEPAAPTA